MDVFPSVIGDKVTVNVPKGMPELMMLITREVLRTNPEDENAAHRVVAGYLKWLLEKYRGRGDSLLDAVMQMKINSLIRTEEDKYIEQLKASGYTTAKLDTSATIIQQWWKSLRIEPTDTEELRIHEMLSEEIIQILDKNGITSTIANEAASKIQESWRKYHGLRLTTKSPGSNDKLSSYVEDELSDTTLNYENDFDERVNVVTKGQRDYVPPIPDFIIDDDLMEKVSFEDDDDIN
ncbi:Hypothetical protein CINCED_3A024804 [Cinara cedri]|uniref:Uncharacterized protein n=1 Tax=Cinara cedri TaxID=506608 RepID=A0A5E4MHH8_9HEMI|nr:Hypothetical protein CINCED_3A024804 [Cinara cedri]